MNLTDFDPVLRIIDYKTGSVHAVADTAEDAAQAAYKAKHLFQLQLYANLHNMFRGSDRPIKTVIYDISRILKEKTSQSPGGVVEPKIEGKELAHHLALTLDDGTDFNDMFMDSVKRTIEELLNPDCRSPPPTMRRTAPTAASVPSAAADWNRFGKKPIL